MNHLLTGESKPGEGEPYWVLYTPPVSRINSRKIKLLKRQTCTTSSSNPVGMCCNVTCNIVIDDSFNGRDVQTTS